jgi:hypothetical protein
MLSHPRDFGRRIDSNNTNAYHCSTCRQKYRRALSGSRTRSLARREKGLVGLEVTYEAQQLARKKTEYSWGNATDDPWVNGMVRKTHQGAGGWVEELAGPSLVGKPLCSESDIRHRPMQNQQRAHRSTRVWYGLSPHQRIDPLVLSH